MRTEQYTQAYQAGVLIAMIHNLLPKEQIPPIVQCMVHYHALRQLLGERLWQKLKSRRRFRNRVLRYESLTYQPFLPKSIMGRPEDFILGYAKCYDKCKIKKELDEKRQKALVKNL